MAWRKPTTVHEWLGILLRHKKKFVFPALIVAIAVILGGGTIEPNWQTAGQLERVNDPLQQQRGSAAITRNVEQERRTIRESMLDRAAMVQVIRDLDLGVLDMVDGRLTTEGARRQQELVETLQSRLRLRMRIAGTDYDLIEVTYVGPDRARGPRIVNQVIENYLTSTMRRLESSLTSTTDYVNERVKSLSERKRNLEGDLQNHQTRWPRQLPENPGELRLQIAAKAEQLAENAEQIEKLRSAVRFAEEYVQSASQYIEERQTGRNPDWVRLQQQIGQIENEYRQRRASGMTDLHPTLVRLRANLESLYAEFENTPEQAELGVTTKPNQRWHEEQQNILRFTNEIRRLQTLQANLVEERDALTRMERQYTDIREVGRRIEQELADVRRDLSMWEQTYRDQEHALRQMHTGRAVNYIFRQRAIEASRPVSPDVRTILGAALVLGLMVGAGLVLASEVTNRTFRNIEHATDELRLPVFGAVDQIASPGQAFRRRLIDWVLFPVAAFAMILVLLLCIALTYSNFDVTRDREFTSPLETIRQVIGV
ncbi:MAG: hypothetical protein JJU36_05310 [Phycisphaeraceae bacterium]|nr:hypothetical protein [Phycisphaeraceae bacterium]